ncbi:hypothetical protein RYX36_006709 [Vicia faba]
MADPVLEEIQQSLGRGGGGRIRVGRGGRVRVGRGGRVRGGEGDGRGPPGGGGGMTEIQRAIVRACYWTIGACAVVGVMGWTLHLIDIESFQSPEPPMPPPKP